MALKRKLTERHRLEAQIARNDTRAWVVNRRERTRQLIELGGLVAKAGLVELAGDDRAVLYGAFIAVADRLSGEDRERALDLWRRRGKRAFDQNADVRELSGAPPHRAINGCDRLGSSTPDRAN